MDIGALGAILGLIAAVIGIISGAHYITQLIAKREVRRISWRRIRWGVVKIIGQLRRDNFIPDLVVCIGRSGAILGGVLAGNMGNLPIALVDRKLQWDDRKRDVVLSEFTELRFKPENRKILFVIGEVYSAQSVTEVVKFLQPVLEGRQWRTACLAKLESAPLNVEYVGFVVSKKVEPAWVFSSDYKRL